MTALSAPLLQIPEPGDTSSPSFFRATPVAGPIAQRRGYANLVFGLAGGHFVMHGLPLQEAEQYREAVLDSIARVDFSELTPA